MKVAYNQNDVELYLEDGIYKNSCTNCIFIRPERRTCVLADLYEKNFYELPNCGNSIFIPKLLSNIFEL